MNIDRIICHTEEYILEARCQDACDDHEDKIVLESAPGLIVADRVRDRCIDDCETDEAKKTYQNEQVLARICRLFYHEVEVLAKSRLTR